MERVAAVDIGSNTLLCLIAQAGANELVRRHDLCRFGRLSQGLDASGSLSDAAIARCLDILREFRQLIDEECPTHVACVATEAVRKASNRDAFVVPGQEILGTSIDVIAGEREAALTHRAVMESIPCAKENDVIIVDVGGASTELIVTRNGAVDQLASLPIGAVRLTERHKASRDAAEADIRAAAKSIALPTGRPLIATAGTATTLAAMDLELAEYDPDRVHNHPLEREALGRRVAQLYALPIEDRKQLVGLEEKRADVIAAGAAIFHVLAEDTDAPNIVVSDRGVRWGLAYELL